jgi:hypothetical protein
LRKSLSGNVVRLVYYERSERVKRTRGPRANAQGLNHSDDEIIFNLEIILLDSTNRRTWTKLTDALDPLVSQESLVNYNERPPLEPGRKSEGADSFSQPHIE